MFMKYESNEIMAEHLALIEKAQEKRDEGGVAVLDPELERKSTRLQNLIEARDLLIFGKGAMFGAMAVVVTSMAAYLLGLYY